MKVLDWPSDIPSITGKPGEMEAACRNMIAAAVAWLSERPTPDLAYSPAGFPLSEDAKNLHQHICDAEPAFFGILWSVATNHGRFIHSRGWEAYLSTLREQA